MEQANILIYYLRNDLRVADNPILHHLATSSDHGFTHLLPIFVLPAHQIEVSGFVRDGESSPYPEARSAIGKYWRCGPHRAKFLAQAVWNLKDNLESLGSGLCIQPGKPADVVDHILGKLGGKAKTIGALWMIGQEGVEEIQDEKDIMAACDEYGVECKVWQDEKYFIDDRDLDMKSPDDLADVFTTYRKAQEPLKTRPRVPVPRPQANSLPPLPAGSILPPPLAPFDMTTDYADLETRLLKPLSDIMPNPPSFPENATSAHPLRGGEDGGQERLHHVIHSGLATHYKDSRNGLVGPDFSTKLSGYLALGCLTARQVHEKLAGFEDGTNDKFKSVEGFGAGENQGTSAIRFELLWRDYMRLCSRKFKGKLFRLKGFWDVEGEYKRKWKTADPKRADKEQSPGPAEVANILERFYRGTTGFGLVDASMRELFHTGYTANRARQNVASFLTRRLGIDWRYGAEWYEMWLIDYDASSNWANWQYVAGIGNDPKETRVFNPVKQAFEYDPNGDYVRMWMPELAGIERLENLFQVSTTSTEEAQRLGLAGVDMMEKPVERITYYVDRKPPKRGDRFHVRGQRGGPSGGGFSFGGGRPGADAPPGAPRGPRRSSVEGCPESRQRDTDGATTQPPPAGPSNRGRRGGGHGGSGNGNGNGIDHNAGGRPSRGSHSNRRNRGYRGSRGSPRGGFSGLQHSPHGGNDFPYYPGPVQALPFPDSSGHIGPHWMVPHPGPHM